MPEGESVFSEAELSYLHAESRLGRLATVGKDCTPSVVPVGWSHNAELDTIDVTGRALDQTKKFRDVAERNRPYHITGYTVRAAELSDCVRPVWRVLAQTASAKERQSLRIPPGSKVIVTADQLRRHAPRTP